MKIIKLEKKVINITRYFTTCKKINITNNSVKILTNFIETERNHYSQDGDKTEMSNIYKTQ